MTTAPESALPAKVNLERPRSPALRAEAGPTPLEKAGIILNAIGPEVAGPFLRGLPEPELKRIARAVGDLGRVSQELLDRVVVEFLEALTSGGESAGGANAARRLLGSVLDEDGVMRLLGEDGEPALPVWERLNRAPLPALAAYLAMEHVQTVALVLSELKTEVAASVPERLDREFAHSVVLRLSRVPGVDARVGETLQAAIERDFLSLLQRNLSKRRPADLIAGLMNNISSEAREGFLGHLESREPELAADVQRTMFTFDDIAVRLAARDIAATIRDVPDDVLLAALKLGQARGSATVAFVIENVPRRLAERYVEDLENMPDPGRKDGEAAQMELTKAIMAKAKSGQIRLLDADGG